MGEEKRNKWLQKLWETKAPAETKKRPPHILLSYQWNAQKEVIEVSNKLKEAGYRVWLDIEQMEEGDNVLSSMAEVIETAAIVMPFLTEGYARSTIGRTEMEYAMNLKKRIVPVKLEPKYRPEGWVNIMLGGSFIFDLTKPDKYEQTVSNLIKAVGDDAKVDQNKG